MHICILIPKLTPFRDGVFIGGATNAMIALSRALAERGHTVSIVAGSPEPKKEPPLRKTLSWANIYFVPVMNIRPARRGIQTFPAMLHRAVQVCRLNNCHLVHSHSGYAHWAGLGAIVGLLTRRPAVHTLYCPLARTMNDKYHPLTNTLLARLSLSVIDHIIAISRNVRRSLLAAGIKSERIAVIPPPINDYWFSAHTDQTVARRKLNLAVSDQVLLFVGNLTQTKGVDVLFKATKYLIASWPQLRLVYTVEKGATISYEREKVIRELIAKLKLDDRIIELGIVKDVPGLMAACEVVVVPYRSTEGPSDYPMAMLEAMAVGRPVVATRVGGVPEIITDGETGMLVAPDDPVDLARGLAAVLSAPSEAKRMGKKGASIVRKRFVSGIIAQAMEQIYSQILKQQKKGNLP